MSADGKWYPDAAIEKLTNHKNGNGVQRRKNSERRSREQHMRPRSNTNYGDTIEMISRPAIIAIRIRNHMKTTKTSPTPDAPAITFKTNVMLSPLPGDPLNASRIIEAGQPSPWTDVADVPATLRHLIGVPNFDPPPNTPNQYWTPKSVLDAEAAAFAALNSNEDMNPSLREELESRDAAYLRESAQRNALESEIQARESEDRRRLVAELEAENRRKLGGKL